LIKYLAQDNDVSRRKLGLFAKQSRHVAGPRDLPILEQTSCAQKNIPYDNIQAPDGIIWNSMRHLFLHDFFNLFFSFFFSVAVCLFAFFFGWGELPRNSSFFFLWVSL